jgi:ubiquinone/menaquinone biosynthesis C-methylase UbiE
MQQEGKGSLLEIGSGTGIHAKLFQDQGIRVIATDLSPKMVERCQEKGLEAYEMDFMNLNFKPSSFDAIFAMNCLLHVPQDELSSVLLNVHRLLLDGGLFYWGQYGGIEKVGINPEDHYEPKRFYSLLTDERMLFWAKKFFSLEQFKKIPVDEEELHFQSLILRK